MVIGNFVKGINEHFYLIQCFCDLEGKWIMGLNSCKFQAIQSLLKQVSWLFLCLIIFVITPLEPKLNSKFGFVASLLFEKQVCTWDSILPREEETRLPDTFLLICLRLNTWPFLIAQLRTMSICSWNAWNTRSLLLLWGQWDISISSAHP